MTISAVERKVLLLSDAIVPSPGYRFLRNLSLALGKRARAQTVAMWDQRHPTEICGRFDRGRKSGIYLIDASMGNLTPRLVFPSTRQAIAEAEDSGDIIHYTSLNMPIMSNLDRAVLSLHDSPISLFRTHLYETKPRHRVIQKLRFERFRRAKAFIVHSRHVADALVQFGFGPVYVVHLPINQGFLPLPDKFGLRREMGLPRERKLVLSVSTSEFRKNLSTTKRVMNQLGDQYVLVRVGPPVDGAVNFQDLSDSVLVKLYNACDVLLMPSLEEGFGLPVIEAFAVGLPVVASQIEVFEEICSGAAELCPPLDAACLARAVTRVVAHHHDYSARSLERAQSFRFERFQESLERAYRKIDQSMSN